MNKKRPIYLLGGTAAVAIIVLFAMALVFSQTGGGGGGGAPTDATYVTITTNATLTAERVLTGTSNQVTVQDNGAGSTVVLSLPQDIATTSGPTFDSLNIGTDIALTGNGSATTSEERIYHLFPGSLGIASRDVIELVIDSNNNSSSTLNIKANGTAVGNTVAFINELGVYVSDTGWAITDGTDTLTVTAPSLTSDHSITFPDAAGEITLLGQAISPDDFDNLDTPANGECATYNSGQIEWQSCGSGSEPLTNDLPVESGATPSTTIYNGVPGTSFQGTAGSFFVTTGDIYYEPFQIAQDITINQVSFLVGTAGNPGDGCRVGIYTDAGNMQPGTLITDWGVILDDSTGWHSSTVSTAITAGAYLATYICNSGPAITINNGMSYISQGTSTSTTSATRFIQMMRVSSPTGTPYTSGFSATPDSWDTVDLINTGGFGHRIVFRWS